MKYPIAILLGCIILYLMFLGKSALPMSKEDKMRADAEKLYIEYSQIAIKKGLISQAYNDTALVFGFARARLKSDEKGLLYAVGIMTLVNRDKAPLLSTVDSLEKVVQDRVKK